MLGNAPLAQLDRAPGFEPGGRAFESLRVRHFLSLLRGHFHFTLSFQLSVGHS